MFTAPVLSATRSRLLCVCPEAFWHVCKLCVQSKFLRNESQGKSLSAFEQVTTIGSFLSKWHVSHHTPWLWDTHATISNVPSMCRSYLTPSAFFPSSPSSSFLLILEIFLLYRKRVWDKVSLCSPGWPGTHSVDQAALKLMEILLPPPPERWD